MLQMLSVAIPFNKAAIVAYHGEFQAILEALCLRLENIKCFQRICCLRDCCDKPNVYLHCAKLQRIGRVIVTTD